MLSEIHCHQPTQLLRLDEAAVEQKTGLQMTKALVAYSAEGSVQQMRCPTAVVHQSLNSCWWWRTPADYFASRLQDKTKMSIVHFISTSVAVPPAERAYLLLPRLAVGLLRQRRRWRFLQWLACHCTAHFCSGPSSISVHALFEP